MFDEILKNIVARTDGAVGALIMGLDGISVARAGEESTIDIDVIGTGDAQTATFHGEPRQQVSVSTPS